MKNLFLMLFLLTSFSGVTQKYTSEKSLVIFFSDAALEDIRAENTKSTSEINLASGAIKVTIKNIHFQFAKALMKEHFNEKYMETERYKESTLQGTISGYSAGNSGEQTVVVKGKLSIHGQTQDVEIPGTLEMKENKLYAKAKFMVKLNDYKIKIPQLLWQNIAEEVEVTIDIIYKPE